MSIDLEDQLRQAYGQLPDASADPTDVIARSRRTAVRSRRRRTTGVCAGAVAATLVVGTSAVVGANFGTTKQQSELLPAGAPQGTSSMSFSASTSASPSAKNAMTRKKHSLPLPTEGADKPLAGLSGKLLPHGSQLPTGLAYHGSNTQDSVKTWSTSQADGSANQMPVGILIGAEQTANAPTIEQTNAAYGIVSGAWDMASNDVPDTGSRFRSVDAAIVRFRTPAFAQSAIAKTQRKEGGLYWVFSKLTTPNVTWSGVPGATGDHGVYNLPAGGPQPTVVAYQVVGEYIVSANSETAATAEQAVTDMVANLKTAGLLK